MTERKYKTEDDLPPELCCPICCHIPSRKVFQCREGHTVCEDCLKKLPLSEREIHPRCSQCRQILAGDGLIQNKNLEKIVNSLKLDCCFNSNGCPETQMPRKVLREHQDNCIHDPAKFGPAVKFCQLLFHPDCNFGMTSGTGKLGVEHFKIHKSIFKKGGKFHIQQSELMQNAPSDEDNSSPFWTPIFVEVKEKKCNILISVVSDPTKNSLGFISFLIPYKNKTDELSKRTCPIQVEFSISNGPAKKSFHSFTQIPIILSKAEETILQILQEPLPPPRKLQSSNAGQHSGSVGDGKGLKIAVNVKQIQPREAQRPSKLEMFTSDTKILNEKVPSSSPQLKNPMKNKIKGKTASKTFLPSLRSGLILLMAIGAIYWGNVVWRSGGDDQAVNNRDTVFHHENIYVPKDENGNFIDMTPAQANATFWEIVHSTQPNLYAEYKQHISANSGKRKDLGEFTVVGELREALDYLWDKMGEVKRKNELISEFELLPLPKYIENNQNQLSSKKESNAMKKEHSKIYEKEKFAVNQIMDVLVITNQTLAFEKMKLLFENETVKITDINPKIRPNILSLSCRNSTAKIVSIFLKMGLPANSLYKGHTPLHFAISNKNNTEALKISEVLLETGADCLIKSVDKYEMIPLAFAKLKKSEEFTTELTRLYFKYNRRCTLLTFGKEYFKSKLKTASLSFEYLIRESASVGNLEGLQYLLEKAEENGLHQNEFNCGEVCTEKNLTLIHLVFILDKNKTQGLEKIKFLVEKKQANIDANENIGSTYLHFASEYGTAQAVEYFISKGLNVNARNKNFLSPLLAVLANEDKTEVFNIGKVLIENGAKCEYPNMTALDKETLMKYTKILNFLYETYKPDCIKNNLHDFFLNEHEMPILRFARSTGI